MNRNILEKKDIDKLLEHRRNGEFGLHTLLKKLENDVINLEFKEYKKLKKYLIDEIIEFNKTQIDYGIDDALIQLNYELDECNIRIDDDKTCLISVISSTGFLIGEHFHILIYIK